MPAKKFKSYGLRSVHISPLLDEVDNTYGPLQQIEGSQEFTLSPIVETTTLEGDDAILESETQLQGYEWELKNAYIHFDVLKILEGGQYEDIMSAQDVTGQKIGEKYTNTNSDTLPYFGLLGRTSKGGDVHIALLKAKCETVEWSMVNKEYCILSAKGTCISRADGKIRNILRYDGPKTPSETAFE